MKVCGGHVDVVSLNRLCAPRPRTPTDTGSILTVSNMVHSAFVQSRLCTRLFCLFTDCIRPTRVYMCSRKYGHVPDKISECCVCVRVHATAWTFINCLEAYAYAVENYRPRAHWAHVRAAYLCAHTYLQG
jgi:hypothetical protein